MNFRPELAEAVVAGRKWVTRRAVSDNPRSPYHPDRAPKMEGKRIAICPGRAKPRIGSAVVASIHNERFDPSRLRHEAAKAEGFATPLDFRRIWEQLHGDLNPCEVWRIALVDPLPDGGEMSEVRHCPNCGSSDPETRGVCAAEGVCADPFHEIVYLGGPINGCTDEEANGWRDDAKKFLDERGIRWIDPMDRDYRGREMEPGIAAEIVEKDKEDIDRSTTTLLNCPKPSVGTSMECYYAWDKGKRVVAVVPADREPSPWLVYHTNALYHSVAEALEAEL